MHEETGKSSVLRDTRRKRYLSAGISVLLTASLVTMTCPAFFASAEPSSSQTESAVEDVVDDEELLDEEDEELDEEDEELGEEDEKAEKSEAEKKQEAEQAKKEAEAKKKAEAEKKKKAEEARKKAEKARKAAEVLARANSIANRLASLTVSLETASEELGAVNKKIAVAKEDVKRTKKDLKDTKTQLEAARDNVAQSAREMYINGGTRLLSVLLGATDFEDFASRLYLYEVITSDWQETFAKTKELSKKVEEQSKSLSKKLANLKAYQKEAEEKGDEIATNLETQLALLAGCDKKLTKLVNKRTDKYLSRYASTTSKASDASLKWFLGDDAASDSKSGSHPQIVKIASTFLGVPYVWGGETPDGFDCSGLTMYCYAKLGIQLTHFARTQYDEGKHVKKSALMPGDLVFFGPTVEGIHHVGIYIGGDKFLHAPRTGDVVKISKLSDRSDCIGACRPQ